MLERTPDYLAWKNVDDDDAWIFDKLLLARELGYVCGPVGVDVDQPGWYIARPCVNFMGLGLGAQKVWLEDDTDHLPLGHFWCEYFEGRHLSIDYVYGKQELTVEGFKSPDTYTKWQRWVRVDDVIHLPPSLQFLKKKYSHINVEMIDGKVIEVHLRVNPDFDEDVNEIIPVWEGELIDSPDGFYYKDNPDVHGRIGFYYR